MILDTHNKMPCSYVLCLQAHRGICGHDQCKELQCQGSDHTFAH
jgi:hypothetical protein